MKIVAAQLNFTIGDLLGNYEQIRAVYLKNAKECDIVVFSELAITGYPPNDLLLRKGFIEEQQAILDELCKLTLNEPAILMLGAATRNPNRVGKRLHNSVLALQGGKCVFMCHKQLLPTYNIFDENRYFEPAPADQSNLFVAKMRDGKERTVGVLICEDAWNDEAVAETQLYPTNPVRKVMEERKDLRKAEVLITVNASPSHVGKYLERYTMYQTLANQYKVPILYVNQVGGNDALIFDGNSFFVEPNKKDIIFLQAFEPDIKAIQVFPDKFGGTNLWGDLGFNSVGNRKATFDVDAEGFKHIVLGLRDYVQKNGFKKVVIGESGGIDSAVVTALAVEALGNQNVFAITMPSKVSSAGSVDDSVQLCNRLGVKLFTRSIKEEVDLSIANFTQAFGVAPSRLTIENEQARIRGRILMEYSNHFGALVLSTGNKSEMSVGYCTIYGDMCGGLAVIADAYKMEVYGLAKCYNAAKGGDFIPKEIINKEPSAELWEGQKDTDSLPPYPILDAILKLYLERDLLSRGEIADLTHKCEKVTLGEIKRVLNLTDKAEFKRQQAPPVLRIHRRAFGFGRNLPITQKFPVDYQNVL